MIKKQNEPIKNDSKPIFELVIDDMRERAEHGKRIYGTYLQANNGRSALQDAFEEAMDLCLYLKQKIIEEEHARNSLVDSPRLDNDSPVDNPDTKTDSVV